MKTRLVLQLVLLIVMLLAGPSEEFFFEYPKKALTEFFQSLRTKKPPPKMNVQHYHVHYYPIPFPPLAWTKAPDKRDLDKLYGNTLTSFGWSDYHYKYLPDPSIIASSGLLWDVPWDEEILESDDVHTTIDRNVKGILLQVPVNQQFVFHFLKRSRQRQTTTATTATTATTTTT